MGVGKVKAGLAVFRRSVVGRLRGIRRLGEAGLSVGIKVVQERAQLVHLSVCGDLRACVAVCQRLQMVLALVLRRRVFQLLEVAQVALEGLAAEAHKMCLLHRDDGGLARLRVQQRQLAEVVTFAEAADFSALDGLDGDGALLDHKEGVAGGALAAHHVAGLQLLRLEHVGNARLVVLAQVAQHRNLVEERHVALALALCNVVQHPSVRVTVELPANHGACRSDRRCALRAVHECQLSEGVSALKLTEVPLALSFVVLIAFANAAGARLDDVVRIAVVALLDDLVSARKVRFLQRCKDLDAIARVQGRKQDVLPDHLRKTGNLVHALLLHGYPCRRAAVGARGVHGLGGDAAAAHLLSEVVAQLLLRLVSQVLCEHLDAGDGRGAAVAAQQLV
eukprot:Rhum_TRINITY_DN11643_c0_g1::Rhum_TRINITY_DN11643_c0_g1_i1::g.45956::m.45956